MTKTLTNLTKNEVRTLIDGFYKVKGFNTVNNDLESDKVYTFLSKTFSKAIKVNAIYVKSQLLNIINSEEFVNLDVRLNLELQEIN